MSKMNDMAAAIEDLRRCATTISDTVDWLAEIFSSQNPEQEESARVKPELSLEAVRAVLVEKSRQGHTAQVRALLQKYGANKLSEIDPVKYQALLTDAEDLTNAS